MPELTIHFEDGDKTVPASGKTLYEALAGQHLKLNAVCAGKHTCGKCKIHAAGHLSEMTEEERRFLTEEEVQDGVRLACMAELLGDVQVYPQEAEQLTIQTDAHTRAIRFDPPVSLIDLELPPSTLEKQQSDTQILLESTGAAGATLAVQKKLQALLREQSYRITAVVTEGIVTAVLPRDAAAIGMAVDIGTTTVVAYYHDLRTGEKLAVKSGMNRQEECGADVISRIGWTMEHPDGLQHLQELITNQLNQMTREVCSQLGISPDQLVWAAVAGNTVMQHLAAGISPKEISNAPFTPATGFGTCYQLAELGLLGCGSVYLPPCAAGYVGGDITAAVLASGMAEREELQLLIDIGTNGEMVLGGRAEMRCCATAAGPAFEGAHIACGCGGVTGAVDTVTATESGFSYTTIGGAAPTGICGSGLIDALAALLKTGLCDETGRLCDADEVEEPYAAYLEETDDGNRFVLDGEKGLYLTQKDIRELQLAKAAIAAGITTLLHHMGKELEEIETVYIAGGFGAHINKESAATIGLLPAKLTDRTHMIGNAAGAGAEAALLDRTASKRLDQIKRTARYLELSGDPFFMDDYVNQMLFE